MKEYNAKSSPRQYPIKNTSRMSRLIILPSVTHTEDVSTFALHNMRRCFFYCHHLADWQTFGNYNTLSDVLLISGSLVTWGGFKRWRTLEDCRLIIGYFTIKCCKSLHDCWNELKGSEIWGGKTQNLGRIRASVDPAYARQRWDKKVKN